MKNIIIIKLGAMGDVVRTLPLLFGIKEKYPESHITWVTKENVSSLFLNNPNVDRVEILPFFTVKEFDILYNFDIEKEATDLAEKINAKEKYGFYSEGGYAAPFNFGAEYYLNTLFDDEIKKTNKKTYQEMMFDAAELSWSGQRAEIFLDENDISYANEFVLKNEIDTKNLIGIHIGASPRWPSKVWADEKFRDLILKLNDLGQNVVLFAGKGEEARLEKFVSFFRDRGIKIYHNDPNNSLREFISIVNLCSRMICPDSLSLHISLALRKPTAGLFFCTSFMEVYDYGLLKKVVSQLHKDFFPERMNEYSEELVNSIEVSEVLDALFSRVRVVNGIINDGNKFLVILRSEGIHENLWAFPGGVVGKEEGDEEALIREIKEEVGLNVQNIVKKVSEFDYPREEGVITRGSCFLVEVEDFRIKTNFEVLDYKWVTVEEFLELDHIEGLEDELFEVIREKD